MGYEYIEDEGFRRRNGSPVPTRLILKWVLFGILLLIAAAYATISWFMASQITEAKREPLHATPTSVGLHYEELVFPSRKGDVLLSGWFIQTDGSKGVIAIVHGIDSNRASEGVGILDLTSRMVSRGFSVFLFDLRAHGNSGGEKVSGGYFEQQDVLGAFDYLVRRGIPAGRIGFLGFSLGGTVTLMAASHESRLQAIVADSAFADIADLIVAEAQDRSSLPSWLVPILVPGAIVAGRLVYGIDISAIAPIKTMNDIHFPVLFIHGKKDIRVPYSHSVRLRTASMHEDSTLWLVPQAEHSRNFKARPAAYVDRVAGYFEQRFE